jgi:hypothetical protein
MTSACGKAVMLPTPHRHDVVRARRRTLRPPSYPVVASRLCPLAEVEGVGGVPEHGDPANDRAARGSWRGARRSSGRSLLLAARGVAVRLSHRVACALALEGANPVRRIDKCWPGVPSVSSVLACISPRPVQNLHTVGLQTPRITRFDVVHRLRCASLRDSPRNLGWFGYVAASWSDAQRSVARF